MTKYESIQVQAYWFSEGNFWNIGVNGYVEGEDQPVEMECDPNFLPESYSRDEVITELQAIGEVYLLLEETYKVVILFEGSEVKTMTGSRSHANKLAAMFHRLYDLKAKQEGWCITNDSDHNLCIAKIDDPQAWIDDGWSLDYTEPKFACDDEALDHVKEMAKKSIWHNYALMIHNSKTQAW